MTPDVVAKAAKGRAEAPDDAKRKRPTAEKEEEEVAPKRQRDAGNEHPEPVHAEAAPGTSTASGDMETLEGDVQVEEKEQTPAADGEGSPLDVDAPPAHEDPAPAEIGADVAPGGGSQPAPPPAAPEADTDAAPPFTAVPIHAKQYADVHADLTARVEAAEPTAPGAAPWAHLTDHLGDGARARLQALATLHLTDYGAAKCPDAVRQLPPNSARVLLGAPPNCELYQERVMRALARHVGARFLVADSTAMGLEDLPASSRGGSNGSSDDAAPGPDIDSMGGSGGPFTGSPWSSDDEDGMPSLTDRPFAPGGGSGPSNRRAGRPMARRTGAPIPPAAVHISGYAGPLSAQQPDSGAERKRRLVSSSSMLEPRQEDIAAAGKKREEKVEAALLALSQAEKSVSAVVAALAGAAGSPEEAAPTDAPASETKVSEPEAPKEPLGEQGDGKSAKAPVPSPLSTTAEAEELAKFTWAKVFVGKDSLERTSEDHDGIFRRWVEALDFAPAVAADCARLAAWAEARREGRAEGREDGSAATPAVLKAALKINSAIAEVRAVVEEGNKRCAVTNAAAMERAIQRAAEAATRPASRAEDSKARAGNGAGAGVDAGRITGAAATPAAIFKPGDRVMYTGAPGALAQAQAAAGVATAPPAPGNADDRDRDRAASLTAFMGPGDSRGGGSARNAALGAAFRNLMSRREAMVNTRNGGGSSRATATATAAAAPPTGSTADEASNPPLGALGRVVSVSGNRVEVEMDAAFTGGLSLAGGTAGAGFAAAPGDLAPLDEREDAVAASFDALFDVVSEAAGAGPLLVFLPAMDRMLRSNNPEQFRRVKERLAALPQRCLFVGGYCSRSLAREKPSSGASGLSMLFGGPRGGGDSLSLMDDFSTPWYERLGGGRSSSRGRATGKGRAMVAMLPNTLELHPPHADSAVKAWKKMLETDVAAMRERANRASLKKWLDRCGLECEQLEDVHITALALSKKEVEQVVGAAVAAALADAAAVAAAAPEAPEAQQDGAEAVVEATAEPMSPGEDAAAVTEPTKDTTAAAATDAAAAAAPAPDTPRLTVTAAHLEAAAASVQASRAEAAPVAERPGLKDVSADQYERQLLSDVVPPEEIAVGFEDIGALDAVKDTLREVVILPLQRPELFTRGALTRPTKGLLLFGPPGTGKTMLAKAMAAESGAHFLNFSAASLTSRWLGDSEKLVRAAFSLAHKLAPTVIFIDEIDSLLSRRGMGSHEHEAVRKMKTEFLAAWDGLRTSASDRVLVLGATNRPMDLDDAAVRRMPRRIMVPLPDAANREKILKVILKEEELSPDVDLAELARETDGYSGSDLKNLCTAAAYCPLREFLEKEKAARASEGGGSGGGETPEVRAIAAGDFRSAMKQVTPSTHAESATMGELQRWNDQFGEGGSRRAEPLNYYT